MAVRADDFGFTPFNQSDAGSFEGAASEVKDSSGFIAAPQQDTKLKSLFRTLYQPISGRLNITPYGIVTGLWDILGTGESLSALQEDYSPERIAELKEKFPFADFSKVESPEFKEKYMQSLETARNTIPTIGNLERGVEAATGAPLEARTDAQRILKTAGAGFKLTPGTIPSKLQGAAIATGGQAALESAGVPSPIAEFLSLIIGGAAPKVSAITKETKPSGLPVRRFEGLTKERKVTPGQAAGIREAVENDVRNATNKVIQENSVTARALKEDPDFPQKIDSLLNEVENLAAKLPDENLSTFDVLDSVRKRIKGRETKGITSTEADRAYLKEMNRLSKELRKGGGREISNKGLLNQYRLTNKEMKQYFEPGKSKGANSGKRDALLDYNRAIADIWQERYPDSEFNKLFKFTNKRYSELSDLDVIDNYFDGVFKNKKINYKHAQKFIKDDRIKTAFERTLGEEGYKDFKGIIDDFLPTEKSMKLLKEAEILGIKDIAKLAGKWIVTPWWAVPSGILKGGKFVRDELLKSPKFRTTWKTANDSFKQHNFKKAASALEELEKLQLEVEQQEPTNSRQ